MQSDAPARTAAADADRRGLARFVPCAIVAAGEGAQGAGGRLPVGGGDQHQLARVAPGGVVGMMRADARAARSEEHTSELQSLMRISYAVFCLKKKRHTQNQR